jgi:hypothetical protein
LGSDFGTGGLLGSLANLGQLSAPSATGNSPDNFPPPASDSSPFGNPPPSPWDIPPGFPWSVSSGAIHGFGGFPNVNGLMPPQTGMSSGNAQFDTSGGASPPQLDLQSTDPNSSLSTQYGTASAGNRTQSGDQYFSRSPSPVDWTAWPTMASVVNGPAIGSFDFPGRPSFQLVHDEDREDREDFSDPLADFKTQMYNSLRNDLRNLQPNNYKLSQGSLRTPGSAPTFDEIGEFRYALGVARSTQPLAEQAMRIQAPRRQTTGAPNGSRSENFGRHVCCRKRRRGA